MLIVYTIDMPISDVFSKQLKKDDALRWLAFSVIALAVLVFYFPSLYFAPRADQVIYLSETSNLHHPWDLIVGCYDHNRHRTIGPGDELLFRPLLYALLGCEQVLFGHHFWAWQIVGIFAYLVLIWVLLRLLWHLSNPWLAFAGTWLFALSVFNYELVTWPHLSSYLLMMACVVGAVEQVVFCFEENQVPWGRLIRLLIYFFIASFIYETANIFILIITGMLIISFPKMKYRLSLLTTPVILYVLFSYFNYTCVDHTSHHSAGPANGVWMQLSAVVYLTMWWLYEGLFNGMYHYFLAIRTMFLTNEVMVFKPLELNNPQVVLGLVIVMVFLGLAWIDRRRSLKRTRPLIVLLGMLFAYVAVIVVGRSSELGNLLATVKVNSYFLSIFWVIIVMIAFLSITAHATKTRLRHWLIIIFVTASLLSGLWQGRRIYDMAVQFSAGSSYKILLITTLDMLIQKNGSDPSFSFYVDPEFPGNYSYGSIRKQTDPPDRKYTYIEFLYPQYFRPRAVAKYKFIAVKAQ